MVEAEPVSAANVSAEFRALAAGSVWVRIDGQPASIPAIGFDSSQVERI